MWMTPLLWLTLGAGTARVERYEIDAYFEPQGESLEARAVLHLEPALEPNESLVLLLHDELEVEGIECDGEAVEFRTEIIECDWNYTGRASRIEAVLEGRSVSEVTVDYLGLFTPDTSRARSDYMRIDEGGVFLRGPGYSLWFPVLELSTTDPDTRAKFDVILRTPEQYVAVFTGERHESSMEAGERAGRWSAECPLIDAQCTARPYAVTETDDCCVYHLSGSGDEQARAIAEFAAEFTRWCRAQWAPHATPQRCHVLQMPEFGDIASGNVVGISPTSWRSFSPDSSGAQVLAHELVHAFVQFPVAAADPLYAFSVEGLPSYFHLYALDRMGHPELYHAAMESAADSYRRGRERATPPERTLLAIAADDIGLYKDRFVLSDRALLFLDDLRARLGDDAFDGFWRAAFSRPVTGLESWRAIVRELAPDQADSIERWLGTTDDIDQCRASRDP